MAKRGAAVTTPVKIGENKDLRRKVLAQRKAAAPTPAQIVEACAAICSLYYDELRSRDVRARVHAAGVGADEEAVAECERRIRALLPG